MTAIVRACGTRLEGQIYLVSGTAKEGLAIEHFLIDPPLPVDLDAIGASPIGTHFFDRDGVTHVLDVVGAEHYELPIDFVEETRRFGLSRRIARNSDFARLGPGSRIFLAHAKAGIDNTEAYHAARGEGDRWCPKQEAAHIDPAYTGACFSLLYEDATGVPASDPEAPDGILCGSIRTDITGVGMHRRRHEPRSVVRTLPSFSYRALHRPAGVAPQYHHAIFLALPIHRIEVVRDPHGDTHLAAIEAACQSKLDVALEDE